MHKLLTFGIKYSIIVLEVINKDCYERDENPSKIAMKDDQ